MKVVKILDVATNKFLFWINASIKMREKYTEKITVGNFILIKNNRIELNKPIKNKLGNQ